MCNRNFEIASIATGNFLVSHTKLERINEHNNDSSKLVKKSASSYKVHKNCFKIFILVIRLQKWLSSYNTESASVLI